MNESTDWIPMFALPNVAAQTAFEFDRTVLASVNDGRVQALAAKYPNFATYLSRFTTEFGRPVEPSLILVRADAPPAYRTVEAIAGFRDAIALSVVPVGWAQALRFGTNLGILYSDAFTVYPWMVDKNYEDLITRTMAVLAVDEVSLLRAQSTAGFGPRHLNSSFVDIVLLDELGRRWARRYRSNAPAWEDTALFRSLNMANAAALLPAGADVTTYDIGRSVALWVGAFEILAHPGAGKNGYLQVYELLERVAWNLTACKEEKYQTYGYDRDTRLRNLPCWIYGEINHARNHFLHGEPLAPDRLLVAQSQRSLFNYAAPLYRMALTGFLDLRWKENPPDARDVEAFGRYVNKRMEFGGCQRDMEAALATVLMPDARRRPA